MFGALTGEDTGCTSRCTCMREVMSCRHTGYRVRHRAGPGVRGSELHREVRREQNVKVRTRTR